MSDCIFCDRASLEVLAENRLAFAIRDKYPVRRLHTLVLPKRHVIDSFCGRATNFQAILSACFDHFRTSALNRTRFGSSNS
ncbi:HIT domain-containing protein (plasmid) [Rhizobium gallicum]|nr:HIT domain-containing protein [Rhizobium gallicum]ULJ76065.1 HIT domain-containing protein [Rhizobium gallicum]